MKKNLTYIIGLFALLITSFVTSCDDEVSYADLKEQERSQIEGFLQKGTVVLDKEVGDTLLYVPGKIRVISEAQFAAQDSTTDVSKNEYVLLASTGIYMQIIRKGIGKKLESGESATIINRFVEFNISGDTIQSRNNSLYFSTIPDIMTCENSLGVFSASYTSGVMNSLYGASVPSSWLVVLSYIKLGRQESATDKIAKVRLIVPHSQNHSDAITSVYPCFYEITYQKGR